MISVETANIGNLILGLALFILSLWFLSGTGYGPIWWAWRFLRRLARHIRLWIWWTSWHKAAEEWESPLKSGDLFS